ncbi:MAG: hypothetical protein LAT64_13080 [Phycisphaerales bacterium]|nr:hypothetical protein [Planctomycetota bacterium]MCH8509688.1 hypothetical protein [Phycisphaerales bacterium]
MATTLDTEVRSVVGQWSMRVEVAPRKAGDDRSLSSADSEARSHALAAWLLDEWKREQRGKEAGR